MKLPPIDYVSPQSVGEVIELLQRHEDAKILSGGQSLMPMLAFRVATCSLLVDLKHVPELDRITIDETGVELGAKVRWRDIEQSCQLHRAHPLLTAIIPHIAHYQIRNRGTVGGSLAHADPAAEMPALAVTCDAQIVTAGPKGQRVVLARDFFTSALVTALEPCEMILALRLPPWPSGRRFGFQEFARRRGDFALAGAIVYYDHNPAGRICEPHIGVFGVTDTPVRLYRMEQALSGALPNEDTFAQAAALGTAALDCRSDIHADGDYRRALLSTLLKRALLATTQRGEA